MEQLPQFARFMGRGRFDAATDALAADEHPRHGTRPGQLFHVVLNLGFVVAAVQF